MRARRFRRGMPTLLRPLESIFGFLLASVPGAVSALALVACSTTSARLGLPPDQVAVVVGLDEHRTFGRGLGLAFEAVDGKTFGSGLFASMPMTIEVLPGKHVLRCFCASTFDGLQGPSGSVDVELDARAGAVYQGRNDFGWRGEILVKFTELPRDQAEAFRAKQSKIANDAAGVGG